MCSVVVKDRTKLSNCCLNIEALVAIISVLSEFINKKLVDSQDLTIVRQVMRL